MATNKEYNGWKNYQTWNVAVYISNEEWLYNAARDYMRKYPNSKRPYGNFIKSMGMERERTADNIAWYGTRLDYKALNEFMREIGGLTTV